MNIYTTGIRNAEFITSSDGAKQNVGTIAQIFGFYPPSEYGVEQLKFTDLRDKFSKIEFFKHMSVPEILNWCNLHKSSNNDLYLNEPLGPGLADLKIKFYQIAGPDMISKFTPDQRTYLVELEEPILISKVYKMSAGKENHRGRKNLIFRPNNWQLLVDCFKDIQFKGYVIDISKSSIYKLQGQINTQNYVIVGDLNIALVIPQTPAYTPDELASHIDPEIAELIGWFSPWVYKSCIQKIVRTRTPTMNYLDTFYDSKKLLVTSFCMLLRHPGAFDYILNIYTSGFESAAKRLAVTIIEDSYISEPFTVLSMLAATYIRKKHHNWKPSYQLIKLWIAAAVEAWETPKMYKYTIQPIDLEVTQTPLNLAYQLINVIRSFHSDIYMFGHVAENLGVPSTKYIETGTVTVPILHCLDHHNIRDIAWHFPYASLSNVTGTYRELFKQLWDDSSSINPRKTTYPQNFQDTDFMKLLRQAQYEIWIISSEKLKNRKLQSTSKYTSDLSIHESWLSAFVGPKTQQLSIERFQKPKIRITVVSVIDPNNINNFIVVLKPARDNSKLLDTQDVPIVLTEDEKQLAINSLKADLRIGVPGIIPNCIKHLVSKITITYNKGIYYCKTPETPLKTWEQFRHFSVELPYHSALPQTVLNACLWTGTGIEEYAGIKALAALKALDQPTRNRLLMYITPVSSNINLHSIDLKGQGTYYQVATTDSGVYEFLAKLCVIFPAYYEVSPKGFRIKYGPGAWKIFEEIREILNNNLLADIPEKVLGDYRWKTPIADSRELYGYQVEALEKMKAGTTAHLIYITPGLGKTLIAMNYIKYCIEIRKMPKYCVYTLPKSAKASVIQEFKTYGFRINILDLRQIPTANIKLRPWCINFIEHDHLKLRDFKDVLGQVAAELFFLVDEFHYTLAKTTYRSSITLSIAKIAKYLVGMTGTLITNDNAEPVIHWLSLIARFEVTLKNYWCAMALLIASRIQTQVVVKSRKIDYPMDAKSKKRHDNYLETGKLLDAVKLCHLIIQDAIVQEALKYISNNIGVFIIAKDAAMQKYIAQELKNAIRQINIFEIDSNNSIHYTTEDSRWFDAIITTPKHSTGYTITKIFTTIESVYFGNEATRTQLRARTNRIGQIRDIEIITLHTGVLTYILERYNKIQNLADFISGFGNLIS